MGVTLSVPLRLRRSSTAAAVPTTAQLSDGELAQNVNDGRLFGVKNVSGIRSIITLGAEMSAAVAAALKETTGTAFLSALGVTLPQAPQVLGPAATTSGTSIEVAGIPSWAKRVTVVFSGVSTVDNQNILLQLGTASAVEATGYSGNAVNVDGTIGGASSTVGFLTGDNQSAAYSISGVMTFHNVGGNTWIASTVTTGGSSQEPRLGAGVKTLSGALTRVKLTTAAGGSAFDAGSLTVYCDP